MLYGASFINWKKLLVIGFPSCGKTVIHTLICPIWSIIAGKAKRITIVTLSKNGRAILLDQMRRVVLTNEALKQDFPIVWKQKLNGFVLPRFGAQIEIMTLAELNGFGTLPDAIIFDPMQSTLQLPQMDLFARLSELLEYAKKGVQLTILGRGDGKHGANTQLMEQCIAAEALDSLPIRVSFLDGKSKSEVPRSWKARYPDKQAIKRVVETCGTGEQFLTEYLMYTGELKPFLFTKSSS